ncbi:hypothetical protein CE91St41_24700 [Oscillospiraceae bacterium]|nr:hypothetical protein CE91St40_12840 [Oscillospiraceae bacterium]BDF75581.1 hypothetical protein CE91St41_24700 [Oscillospiraceae bacterium]
MQTIMDSPPAAAIPLYEILQLNTFADSRILAGEGSLDRGVVGINQLDAPDISNWARPGELLVTTGFVVKDDLNRLSELVDSAVHMGLAGLCIKPKRFIQSVPDSVIDTAAQFEFPLIELSPQAHFDDMLKEFYTGLIQRQALFLEQVTQLKNLVMRLLLEGGTLEAIAQQISELAGNSVFIEDTLNHRGVMSCCPSDMAVADGKEALLKQFGAGCASLALSVEGHDFGTLYIFPTCRSIRPNDIALVRELVLPVVLEISREFSLREMENGHFNDFLVHLFNDKISDIRREEDRASNFQLSDRETYLLICLRIAKLERSSNYYATLQIASAFSNISALFQQIGYLCRIAHEGPVYYLIITAQKRRNLESGAARRDISNVMRRVNETYPKLLLGAGCGQIHTGLPGLIQSRNEAMSALRMSELSDPPGELQFYRDMGLLRFVYSEQPAEEAAMLIQDTLGNLLTYSPKKRAELLDTLDHYFSCFGNLKKMSEEMYTHYNTIAYRMKRIEELTGLNLDSEDSRLKLQVALRLYMFSHGNP